MNKKAAIELSMNFIVVIVISIAVLALGFVILNKIIANGKDYTGSIDKQTQEQLKSMMLSNNDKVTIYPTVIELDNNKALPIGVGITNEYTSSNDFKIYIDKIEYFSDSESTAILIPQSTITKYYATDSSAITILPKSQTIKTVLIKMPSDAKSGQYIFTLTVKNSTLGVYDTAKIHVTNP